ncbi:MAG: Thioredoxin [Haloplasmataceae bacterium]|jgi:thiol-disulfide isomerase/thioredoxin|nr:Thioredoxin [Haloplasmataceae bacterium]
MIKKIMTLFMLMIGLSLLTSCYPKAKVRVYRDEFDYFMYISDSDCSDCQSITEEVNQYKAKADSDTTLLSFYNIDLKFAEYTDIKEDFGVSGTPTLLYIKDGRVYDQADETDEILELLKEHYGKL